MRLILLVVLCLSAARTASAACMNKFMNRTEGSRQVVTLLTGKLTYQEAIALSQAIKDGQAEPVEWISDTGKSVAKQFGDLKVIRPMPVGCDDKKSGVVLMAAFPSLQKPAKKMTVKFDAETKVTFDEQQ